MTEGTYAETTSRAEGEGMERHGVVVDIDDPAAVDAVMAVAKELRDGGRTHRLIITANMRTLTTVDWLSRLACLAGPAFEMMVGVDNNLPTGMFLLRPNPRFW